MPARKSTASKPKTARAPKAAPAATPATPATPAAPAAPPSPPVEPTIVRSPERALDAADYAKQLGMKTSEIASVTSSPAGTVIVTSDGVSMIDVPADTPDGDGKTGLMLLSQPKETNVYSTPVYTAPEADD